MDSRTVDKMKHLANTEVVRRLLIKYFMDRGFGESFDRQLQPSLLQDLPITIPILGTKVEIVPHCEDVDPHSSRATIGWNLFVLGTHRMYLGNTEHADLAMLARQVQRGLIEGASLSARRQTTPRRVVAFITRVLANHEAGYVSLSPGARNSTPGDAFSKAMVGTPQQFNKSGWA